MKRALRKLAAAAIWLAVWQIVYMAVGQEVLVASPAAAFLRLCALMRELAFWESVALSLLRILAGYCLAVAVGSCLAVGTAFVPFLNDLFRPAISVVRATPVASFIILALVWMATATVPVFTCFLMVLPIIWGNMHEGICHTDAKLLEMARAFGIRRGVVLRRIYLPSVMPYFIAAATTGIGLAWKAGIAAEVLCRPGNSIGTALYNSKVYLETADLFAWTAVVILLSIVLEKLLVKLIRRAGRRYNAAARGEAA